MGGKKKNTIEIFVNRANKIYGNFYDYSLFIYVNYKTKGKINCPFHGIFEQTPSNHLSGYGCFRCAHEKIGKMKRSNINDFIEKSNKIYGNKYDYSLFEYRGTNIKGKIICDIHGIFEKSQANHLRGQGCPKCGKIRRIKKRTMTIEEFVIRANLKYDNKFDYSLFIYVNARTLGKIKCPFHGIFEQTPDSHLHSKNGCKMCDDKSKRRLTKEIFVERANKINDNFYDYSLFVYVNYDTPGIIICPFHGKFLQTPDHHLRGYGCFKCGKIKTQNKLRKTIEKFVNEANLKHDFKYDYSLFVYVNYDTPGIITCPFHGDFEQTPSCHLAGQGCPKCGCNNVSKKSQIWLDYIGVSKENREIKITINNKKYIVDGIDYDKKIVYEFYGNYWHGNLSIFKYGDLNKRNKKTFGELYDATLERERILEDAGYSVFYIWEEEFDKIFPQIPFPN